MSKCDDHHESLAPQCPDCLNHALADQERVSADLRSKLNAAKAMVQLEHDGHADAVALLQQERDKHKVTLLQVESLKTKFFEIVSTMQGSGLDKEVFDTVFKIASGAIAKSG